VYRCFESSAARGGGGAARPGVRSAAAGDAPQVATHLIPTKGHYPAPFCAVRGRTAPAQLRGPTRHAPRRGAGSTRACEAEAAPRAAHGGARAFTYHCGHGGARRLPAGRAPACWPALPCHRFHCSLICCGAAPSAAVAARSRGGGRPAAGSACDAPRTRVRCCGVSRLVGVASLADFAPAPVVMAW